MTALEYLIGGTSVVVGTASGEVTSWFRATMPDGAEAHGPRRTCTSAGQRGRRRLPRRRATEVSPRSARDGSLIAPASDVRTDAGAPAAGAGAARTGRDRAEGGRDLLRSAGRRRTPFDMHNPHPEVSWRALFGKVWYEGYAEPEYVWQSTGGTDDFEPKLSLVPLIFGTIKGTLYAMLFAIPIAVLAALYTSQFVHPIDQGQDQADGRNHGGAAERRHRVSGGPVSGRRRRDGTSSPCS